MQMELKKPTTKQNQPTHLPLAPSHDEFELLGINEMSCFQGEIMLPGGMRGKSSVKNVLTSFPEKFGFWFGGFF